MYETSQKYIPHIKHPKPLSVETIAIKLRNRAKFKGGYAMLYETVLEAKEDAQIVFCIVELY